jgi:hypothetical protein
MELKDEKFNILQVAEQLFDNETLSEMSFSADEEPRMENEFEYDKEKGCECLPSCASIDYGVEISQSPDEYQKHLKAHGTYDPEDEE